MFVQRLPFRLFFAHATRIHSYPIYWAKVLRYTQTFQ